MGNNEVRQAGERAWLPLGLPRNLTVNDLPELLAACGQVLSVRVVEGAGDSLALEVFAHAGEEHAEATTIAHQAAADQAVRQQIRARSDTRISDLVEAVLLRARSE